VFHVLIWGGLELCLGGLSPPKAPRGDGTGRNWRITCLAFFWEGYSPSRLTFPAPKYCVFSSFKWFLMAAILQICVFNLDEKVYFV